MSAPVQLLPRLVPYRGRHRLADLPHAGWQVIVTARTARMRITERMNQLRIEDADRAPEENR